MANVKITDLAAYTNPDSTDVLPIVDVSADVTKKVSIADLLENAGSGTAAAPGIAFDGDNNTGIYRPGADQLAISTGGTGRLSIDSSGRLLVGTSSARTNFYYSTVGRTPGIQYEASGSDTALSVLRTDGMPALYLANSGTISNNDGIGGLSFVGNDGTNLRSFAKIEAEADGAVSTDDVPGRLVFSTTADGASSPTERMRVQSDGNTRVSNASTLYPEQDNVVSLGLSGNRWSALYASNGTIQTSDQRTKTDIADSSLGVNFIKSLRPVSYKWIEGGKRDTGERDEDNNFIYESVPGARTHWGFVAQEVKEAVDTAGVDFGGWLLADKDNPDSQQALRYDQFIAPLTKALQEALSEIDVLKAKVAALEAS